MPDGTDAEIDLGPGQVRKRIEAREELLSQFALRSRNAERATYEEPHPIRSEYQRDRDRIIHSKSFRRLKHKSQVLIAPKGDHYTTRMTHVMEVAQVGRTIARALNLNEDAVEAAGLGHDLGHTPFGHVGEEVLDQILKDRGGFHHSRHSVRIVEVLEREGRGMNLTLDVVDAIRKHSKPRGEFMSAESVEGMSLEAQIVRLSDALAYLMHDINDAVRMGIIELHDLPEVVFSKLGKRHQRRVNAVVMDVVKSSWDCTGTSSGGIKPYIRMSPQMTAVITDLRDFMFQNVYLPISRQESAQMAREGLHTIWEHVTAHREDIPDEFIRAANGDAVQAAVDYLCGMTDLYAIRKLDEIKPGAGNKILQAPG